MPRLEMTIQVMGQPLRRAYVEHIVAGVGDKIYMTDNLGRVHDEGNIYGIDSATGKADIRVLCQNSVVKVLDGNFSTLAVNQDKSGVADKEVVNLNTNAEQKDHYRILNRCLITYDIVFRQFRPFTHAPRRDFPLRRSPSFRATKDRVGRIEVSFPSQFPLGDLAFTEPTSAGTGFPLMHIRSRASNSDSDIRKAERGRLFGEDGQLPSLIPSELAHALHFSLFSASARTAIQNDYIGWVQSETAQGRSGKHGIGIPTTPKVAYIEALDHFSSRFAMFVRQAVPGGGILPDGSVHGMTDQIRTDFLNNELSGAINHGGLFVTSSNGDPLAIVTGPNDEGSVYGCIFVDFAQRVGLRIAVMAYLRSAWSGATTFGEYKTWVTNHAPQYLNELNAAQATWGL